MKQNSARHRLHHDLVKENGTELLIIAAGDKTYIAKTTSVQDIASYHA
jgi:hypothetical protein